MQGKVLIVDTIAINRIGLKVKLSAAYYSVLQASSFSEAVELAIDESPDLIICALKLPDGGAAGLRSALLVHPTAQNIPVLAIACPPVANDRLNALKAGVLDVLSKPVDDNLLMARVRSLIRDHNASAEWRMRDDTCRALWLAEPAVGFGHGGHCMMVSAQKNSMQNWMLQMRAPMRSKLSHSMLHNVLRKVEATAVPDIFVLALPADQETSDATLRMIATLRANASTRHSGILVLQCEPNAATAANALDMGADDLMIDGFDAEELALRLNALLRRKRRDAKMRASIHSAANAAGHDALTGLRNRRFAMPHLTQVTANARATGCPLAVMVADLDHFKDVNDTYGHASGDAVLVETAKRLGAGLRATDMVARIGGEEFMIIMQGACLETARNTALRLCNHVGASPFDVPGSATPIPVTISIGMAVGGMCPQSHQEISLTGLDLLDHADRALYTAKVRGRNRVTLSRPAA